MNADALLRRQVLGDGFVELIDHLGGEDAPVDAARVSFGKRASEFTPAKNDRLVKYLLEHNHTTPFEMVVYKFRVRAPVVVWWHWVRHRMASYNFISGRYVPFEETDVHRVPNDGWRKQSASNKQGSSGELADPTTGAWYNAEIDKLYTHAFNLYRSMLADGVAREQARLVLPFAAVYYEAIVQMNARSLANFITLRTGGDAQSEIRCYAEAVRDIVREFHPRLWSNL